MIASNDDLQGGVTPSAPVSKPCLSYWQRTTRAFPHLHSNHNTNVPASRQFVIIGSGISGALVAFELTESGIKGEDVVIIEAREAASGASSRNAGHVRPDAFRGFQHYSSLHGPEQALKIIANERLVLQKVDEFVRQHDIHCDFKLSTTFDSYQAEEARIRTRVKGALAAYEWPAGSSHPAKLAQWLLNAAIERSVTLFTHCPVSKVSEGTEALWEIHTARGIISTSNVIHCTNAYASLLLPELSSHLTPNRAQAHSLIAPGGFSGANTLSNTFSLRYGLSHFYSLIQRQNDGTFILGVSRTNPTLSTETLRGIVTFDDREFNEETLEDALKQWNILFPDKDQSISGTGIHGEGLDHAWTGIIDGPQPLPQENEELEDAPLLSPEVPEHDGQTANESTSVSKSLPVIVLYFMAIHFLLAFCELILVAPLIKLFENSLCLSHYNFPQNGINEELCKIPEIQVPLATIRGWKSMFDTIPVLLVTIPTGRLGDRYGRRKIMALALFGVVGSLSEVFVVCAFPKEFSLKLVWLSSIVLLCGGGLNSASSYMWAMASESIPTSKRSHGFYYIFSAFYVAEMVASFVASVTTDISPWIPCSLSMASALLCLLLLAIMPNSQNPEEETLLSSSSHTSNSSSSAKTSALTRLIQTASHPNTIFTLPIFLVGILRYTTLNILIQYAHVRFKLKISTGATFYTETAIVNIFLFLFLIPQVTAYIREKYKVRPQTIDLFLVRMSVSLMCVGALAIGLAPSGKLLPVGVALFASGFGSRVSALSLISYWIPASSKATIYAAITVFESLGHAIGDPSMQQTFAAALKLDAEFWLALPFFVAAGCYFLASVSASFIRVDGDEGKGDRED
ncbi:hypothetical protein G7Y89_g3589 [Cudoniella acicularis]|uniref:FAD dependent oxidoreductase domain-containing protein n=1 Tax=Cudoniella acicularis TaxID=354080 RepID=A0A8H4RR31_9HELO|nr:hypothetical protein G7Y89_g3589 [Cudoniella acicularis]